MKKVIVFLLLGCLCACCLLTAGCKAKDDRTYYELADFACITVGETTLKEVHELIPCEKAWVGNLGLIFSYPMEDGRWIIIMFQEDGNGSEAENYIVDLIEIVDDIG